MEKQEVKESNKKSYTLGEELINSISHGIGALLSVSGLTIGIIVALNNSTTLGLVSMCIYGATLIIMYLMSTLYHAITNEKVKRFFKIMDHCSIFLLIAGTYTPITLVALGGTLGWILFGIIWAIAIASIVFNAIDIDKFKKINLFACLLLGWIIVFAAKPFFAALDLTGIILIIVGGVVFSIGVIFYALKKYKYMHSIWHLFVLAGTILHYLAIVLYILQ